MSWPPIPAAARLRFRLAPPVVLLLKTCLLLLSPLLLRTRARTRGRATLTRAAAVPKQDLFFPRAAAAAPTQGLRHGARKGSVFADGIDAAIAANGAEESSSSSSEQGEDTSAASEEDPDEEPAPPPATSTGRSPPSKPSSSSRNATPRPRGVAFREDENAPRQPTDRSSREDAAARSLPARRLASRFPWDWLHNRYYLDNIRAAVVQRRRQRNCPAELPEHLLFLRKNSHPPETWTEEQHWTALSEVTQYRRIRIANVWGDALADLDVHPDAGVGQVERFLRARMSDTEELQDLLISGQQEQRKEPSPHRWSPTGEHDRAPEHRWSPTGEHQTTKKKIRPTAEQGSADMGIGVGNNTSTPSDNVNEILLGVPQVLAREPFVLDRSMTMPSSYHSVRAASAGRKVKSYLGGVSDGRAVETLLAPSFFLVADLRRGNAGRVNMDSERTRAEDKSEAPASETDEEDRPLDAKLYSRSRLLQDTFAALGPAAPGHERWHRYRGVLPPPPPVVQNREERPGVLKLSSDLIVGKIAGYPEGWRPGGEGWEDVSFGSSDGVAQDDVGKDAAPRGVLRRLFCSRGRRQPRAGSSPAPAKGASFDRPHDEGVAARSKGESHDEGGFPLDRAATNGCDRSQNESRGPAPDQIWYLVPEEADFLGGATTQPGMGDFVVAVTDFPLQDGRIVTRGTIGLVVDTQRYYNKEPNVGGGTAGTAMNKAATTR